MNQHLGNEENRESVTALLRTLDKPRHYGLMAERARRTHETSFFMMPKQSESNIHSMVGRASGRSLKCVCFGSLADTRVRSEGCPLYFQERTSLAPSINVS